MEQLNGLKIGCRGKNIILNAALERTWHYVFSANLVSVKKLCAWKVQFRADKGVQKTLENIYVVELIFFHSEELQSPDKYIQRGASRETAAQLRAWELS